MTLRAELQYTPKTEWMTVDGIRVELDPRFAAMLRMFRWGGMEEAFLAEMRPYLKTLANARRAEIKKSGTPATDVPLTATPNGDNH